MKNFIVILIIIILGGAGFYLFTKSGSNNVETPNEVEENNTISTTTNETSLPENKEETVIGNSAGGLAIKAYHFGNLESADTELLFVGGIHGGYEWNTALVAYELMDYLKVGTSTIPSNIKVTVVPVLNPDGLNKVVGTTEKFDKSAVPTDKDATIAGRFNGNVVDLNRNFDCDWQAEGKWQTKSVSGGTSAFSEPESQAIKAYVEMSKPDAVVVWYSAAGGVYASNCHGDVLKETQTLTDTFAKASGYPAFKSFNFYEITGDMVNWLAKKEIPAISVLLTNHTDTEWSKNQKGVDALLKYYAK